jgi:hypothetical protein
MGNLTALRVKNAKPGEKLTDGGGLGSTLTETAMRHGFSTSRRRQETVDEVRARDRFRLGAAISL